MEEKIFTIPNISCGHCVHTIHTELSELEGIQSVEGSVENKQIKVKFEQPATVEQIVRILTEINYPPA